MIPNSKIDRGFTIIELIITIAVFSFGIVGVYTALSSVFGLTSDLYLRLTAANLAQEGMEIIRNMRDNNFIKIPNNWSSRISACSNGCEADYTTDTNVVNATSLTAYGSSGRFLNIDSNGFYSYSSGVPTKFKRKITTDRIDSDTLKVDVLVSWENKGKSLSVNAIEYLYNWY